MGGGLLALALAARLPLIAVTTRDPRSVAPVLRYLHGSTVKPWERISRIRPSPTVYYATADDLGGSFPPLGLDHILRARESSLVLVNPKTSCSLIFQAGELPIPGPVLQQVLHELEVKPTVVAKIEPLLSGLTLQEVEWTIKLAREVSSNNELDPSAINEVKRASFPPHLGIQPVETTLWQQYMEHPELAEWVSVEQPFFLESLDPRLIPRGLLFTGPPGTGKTLGAKWLATQLGVALYRLDLGGIKSKWVGESEKALSQALRAVDQEAPCVFLVDEVEKLFVGRDDASGVVPALLASLLWWMQEHRSRVLTVLTSNQHQHIPPELVRSGRVDRTINFPGLTYLEASVFAGHILSGFAVEVPHVLQELEKHMQGSERIPQAEIVGWVIRAVKEEM